MNATTTANSKVTVWLYNCFWSSFQLCSNAKNEWPKCYKHERRGAGGLVVKKDVVCHKCKSQTSHQLQSHRANKWKRSFKHLLHTFNYLYDAGLSTVSRRSNCTRHRPNVHFVLEFFFPASFGNSCFHFDSGMTQTWMCIHLPDKIRCSGYGRYSPMWYYLCFITVYGICSSPYQCKAVFANVLHSRIRSTLV